MNLYSQVYATVNLNKKKGKKGRGGFRGSGSKGRRGSGGMIVYVAHTPPPKQSIPTPGSIHNFNGVGCAN